EPPAHPIEAMMSIQRMKLTGAAILVSRGMKVLQAAPAAYPYRSAAEGACQMKPPKCTPYPPSTRYKRVVVRSLSYDNDVLAIEVQGSGFVFACVVFRRPAGFRVLDERDLCEFWDNYHTGNGWLYEVEEGGWRELESVRSEFLAPLMFP